MSQIAKAHTPLAQSDYDVGPGRFAELWHRAIRLGLERPYLPAELEDHGRWKLTWRAGVLLLLIVGAFAMAVPGGWLWHDDAILDDVRLRTVDGLLNIWAHPLSVSLPSVATLGWVEFHLFGPSPVGYHVMSLLLHASTCTFLWLILRRFSVPGAWLIAALAAVHPANLTSVTWLSRQGDLLNAFFVCLAFWAYLRMHAIEPAHATDERWETQDAPSLWNAIVCASAVFGALTGGTAAVLILVIACPLTLRWFNRAIPRHDAIVFLLLTIAAASFLTLRIIHVDGARTHFVLPALVSVVWIPLKTLWPNPLPFVYDRQDFASHLAILVTVAVLVLAICVAIACTDWRSRRPLAFLAILFLSMLAVHALDLSAKSASAILLPDVLPYDACVPLLIAAVAGVLRSSARLHVPADVSVRWGLGIASIAACLCITIPGTAAFSDPETLWHTTLGQNPDCAFASERLSDCYIKDGFLSEAGTTLDAVSDDRRDVDWFLARGGLFDARKSYPDAIACYESALRLDPAQSRIDMALADALTNAGQPEAALRRYEDLAARQPHDPAIPNNIGLTDMRLARPLSAATAYRQALAIDPDFLPAHVNLADALFALGDIKQAAEQLQDVIKLDPRNFPAFFNAGVFLYRLHDLPQAEQMLRAAVHLSPGSADAYNDLGIVLAAQHKLPEAAWSFTQALMINPVHPGANQNLAALHQQLAAQRAARTAPPPATPPATQPQP